ncbi:MAG: OmpH family outer membrane protein [Bacteroidia bacterium]|jgi:outer membrane protein|nr:OmpH family outer membrane protein [Bacteroidia bacterium]
MNRILISINVGLVLAVAFLFYKVYSTKDRDSASPEVMEAVPKVAKPEAEVTVKQVGNVPTGKIAYVNIDRLNEESLEISDLVAESKRRKESIEASMEGLNMKYQNKVEEFQLLQKGGIAPKSEMEAKAREIQGIEQEAQNKQLQMDQLTLDMNRKNESFQRTVRELLLRWNDGRYDYILSYSEAVPTLLLGNSTLEVTEEVIREINNEYKQRKTTKKK